MSRFICLMYHDVEASDGGAPDPRVARLSPSIRTYSVTAAQFAGQIAAIGRNRLMDPELLRHPVEDQSADPRPRVLVTFDDGWAGSFLQAGPILAQAGARAIVFVTTGLVGHPLFASAALLRNLPTDVFEIGSHTVSHPFLAECSSETICRELADSRAELEQILGRKVDTLSLPNGSCDDRVLSIARECGYTFIFSSKVLINELAGDVSRTIGRLAVRSDTPTSTVLKWTNGQFGAADWRTRLLDVPRVVLGAERYRRLRSRALGEKPGQEDMAELVARHRRAGIQAASAFRNDC